VARVVASYAGPGGDVTGVALCQKIRSDRSSFRKEHRRLRSVSRWLPSRKRRLQPSANRVFNEAYDAI